MKRAKNIYEQIIDKNNIREAILNASKGKKNRKNVKEVLENIIFYTDEIHKILVKKTYTHKRI